MLESKLHELKSLIASYKKGVVVGFSAGVDSTVLSVIAHQVLAEKMLAVTVNSELTPSSEIETAQQLAREFGFSHYLLHLNLLKYPEIIKNTPHRCYYCKKLIYQKLKSIAQSKGHETVLDGSNINDLQDFRPGRKALAELEVTSPFELTGFSKREIREVAKLLNLPVWNKPSSACLASRIPFGVPLNQIALHRIEKGEEFLNKLGVKQVRIRDHFPIARIECGTEDWNLILENKQKTIEKLKELGFSFVCLDLDGYKTGSFNPEQRTKE